MTRGPEGISRVVDIEKIFSPESRGKLVEEHPEIGKEGVDSILDDFHGQAKVARVTEFIPALLTGALRKEVVAKKQNQQNPSET